MLTIEKLNIPEILCRIKKLPTIGLLKLSQDSLLYLDIDDDYIHALFPLLNETSAAKPNYFGDNLAGAHISVVYPEELSTFHNLDLNTYHTFEITGVAKAVLDLKTYYVLLVNCPSLQDLREKLKLPKKLLFKGNYIDFHITIGKG